jgi:tryptophanyl-tRNA synthetase
MAASLLACGIDISKSILFQQSQVNLNCCHIYGLVWFMVFNATFNNISVISWWSVLSLQETGQTLSYTVVSSTPRLSEVQTHNFGGDMQ